MQGLKIQDLYKGNIGSVPVVAHRITKKLAVDNYGPEIRAQEAALRKLIRIIRAGDDFYARVNAGCRAGSIVRVDGSQYDVKTPGKTYYSRELGQTALGDLLNVRLVEEYKQGPMLVYEAAKTIGPNIPYQERVKAQYDGRKDVGLSQDEQSSLEYLPDYNGPTVFAFTKTQRTEEERAAMRDPAQHKVFDQIGEEIAIGDLFFYGSANSLTIGKLIKIGKTGSLGYTAFVGGATGRIINEVVRQTVSEGKPVPCLLKFSKDLADKLMIYKLAKL